MIPDLASGEIDSTVGTYVSTSIPCLLWHVVLRTVGILHQRSFVQARVFLDWTLRMSTVVKGIEK